MTIVIFFASLIGFIVLICFVDKLFGTSYNTGGQEAFKAARTKCPEWFEGSDKIKKDLEKNDRWFWLF